MDTATVTVDIARQDSLGGRTTTAINVGDILQVNTRRMILLTSLP